MTSVQTQSNLQPASRNELSAITSYRTFFFSHFFVMIFLPPDIYRISFLTWKNFPSNHVEFPPGLTWFSPNMILTYLYSSLSLVRCAKQKQITRKTCVIQQNITKILIKIVMPQTLLYWAVSTFQTMNAFVNRVQRKFICFSIEVKCNHITTRYWILFICQKCNRLVTQLVNISRLFVRCSTREMISIIIRIMNE